MELSQVMRTTFAAREFTDEPVPDALVYQILDDARFAPSGGNRQGWRVIVVRDGATRREFGAWIAPAMRRYVAQVQAGENPYNTVQPTALDAAAIEATPPPSALIDQVVAAPVLLLVCVDLGVVASFDADLDRVGVISGASIYPFVWNILLAARSRGLGGALTTFLVPAEGRVRELLGIPEQYAVAALLPLGHPVKQLTRLSRRPVEAFATLERFDGPALEKG